MIGGPQSSDDLSSRSRWIRRVSLGLIVLGVGWLVATAWQPVRLNWGDPWSDIDIMTAGRFMAEDGFIATRFTPIVDVRPLDALSFRYVHYPPLAEIINGAVQRVTGSDSLAMFRLIWIAFSALSVVYFFRYVRRIWRTDAAWIAAALFATNSLWLKYADCIHSHPLHLMTGFGALWWLVRWLDDRRTRDAVVMVGWCAANFLSSYDYYLFLPAMIVATPLLLGHRWRDRTTLVAVALGAFGCGLGLGIKCGLAIWALGWQGFLKDLHFQFLERATDKLSYRITREFWRILFFRGYRFFSPVFYLVVIGQLAALVSAKVRRAVGPPTPLVLYAAGIPFVFLMKQLFCEQYHVTLSFLPFFCVGGGVLAAALLQHRVWRYVAGAALAVTLAWHVIEVATFRYAFLDHDDLAPIRAELDAHDHNGFVYATLLYTPSFRYMLDRHMLEILSVRPENLAGELERRTREIGGTSPAIIDYDDGVAAAEDTKVTAYMAGNLGKRWWLRDPWRSRADRARTIGERRAKLLAVIQRVSDQVMRSGAFTLYRLNPAKLRDELYPRPTAVPAAMPAESLAFARAADESVSAPVKLPSGAVVRYSLHHRPMRLLIIAGGGDTAPPSRPRLDFTLRIPHDARASAVTLTVIPTRDDQTLTVAATGQKFTLGRAGVEQPISFVLPGGAGGAIQELPVAFAVDRVDDKGRGVAIRTIAIAPVE